MAALADKAGRRTRDGKLGGAASTGADKRDESDSAQDHRPQLQAVHRWLVDENGLVSAFN